jgi:dipeptidyl aminopeptidase/acylaminoacyl peptidase
MRSNEVHDFGLGTLGARTQNMQLLATRGYAVLSPDAPLGVGTPMVDLVKTVLPGVEKVIELGIADPERLGVMGRSYGGYSTLGLITQTNRFRAAVSWAGFGNYSSMYGVILPDGRAIWHEWAETGQGGMQGTPWEYRERYIENSPQFYLNRIQTPLFLAAGTADTAVAPHLSEDVFVGLRRLGKEVAYARYEGEPHEIFKIPNQIDFWNKLISWFDKHLKAAEKAEGRTQ